MTMDMGRNLKIFNLLKKTHIILFIISTFALPCYTTFGIDWCCQIGIQNSKNSRLCVDYTALSSYTPNDTCKYFYTICCNQNNRNEECERGKAYAYRQESCYDPSRLSSNSFDTYNDAFSECCSCCHLGIVMARNGIECKNQSSLLPENCNKIFLDCCSSNKPMTKPSVTDEDDGTHFIECSEKCNKTQICKQTPDGAKCACPIGYKINEITGECEDINECILQNPCTNGSNCTNTIGSFICSRSCSLGFVYDVGINRCRDVNECAMSIHKCGKGMRCENVPGAYRCIRETPCGTGYSIDSFTQDCVDIDECALKIDGCPPGFVCQNIIGSFRCKPKECNLGEMFNYDTGICEPLVCLRGYTVHNSSGECVDINECDVDANICQLSERCENTPGSFKCIAKISCDRGYESTKDGCIDVDECVTRRHTCPDAATCVNKIGSYTCVCPTGFSVDITGTRCDDVDECSLGVQCPRNSKCVNSIGSYECKCKSGFDMINDTFTDNKYCKDVDECQTPYICQHKCVNAYGSYQCLCNEGFKLGNDKKTCIDVDECKLHKNICLGFCTNTIGSFECSCGEGFELDRNYKRMCYDIDECITGKHNCNMRERCLNTRGSYKCLKIECPPGYFMAGGFQSTRCDRANSVCRNDDNECFRKPMKIFHHYITFTYKVAVPVRIFTPPAIYLPPNGRYTVKYEFKLIQTNSTSVLNALTNNDFTIRYLGTTSIEIILQRSPVQAQEVRLELNAEVYTNGQFQNALLNKLYLFITE